MKPIYYTYRHDGRTVHVARERRSIMLSAVYDETGRDAWGWYSWEYDDNKPIANRIDYACGVRTRQLALECAGIPTFLWCPAGVSREQFG